MGVCEGERACGADGLSECSAPEPIAELCNGQDDDCDGVGDTPGLPGCVPWYVDMDQDGHGHPAKWKCLCGGPSSFIKCSSVHFEIKHKGSTGGQAITKSMNASGWVVLGTFEFCGQKGYVRYDDSATPSNCAVSFDAVRWELQ